MKNISSPNPLRPNPLRRGRAALVGALTATALLALSACGSGDDAKLLNDGEVVIAMSGEFKPFSHFEGNELTGFDHDIAVAIAEELDLELKTETGAFDTLIQGVKSKRYDVLIASMTPTPERDEAVDFSDPYYSSGAAMFVQQDSDCQDPMAMKDDNVGVASGTTYKSFLEDEGWTGEIASFTSDITALEDVGVGRLDGAVTDRLVGLNTIEEAGMDLRVCGEPLYTEEPAFAVREGNEELVDELNAALATIKENGTYGEISEKWFGQDIS